MAVGCPLGQSIYKALLLSKLRLNLYLTDINDMAAGFYIGKNVKTIILPLVRSKDYLIKLKKILKLYDINIIFPVISPENEIILKNMDYFESHDIKVAAHDKDLYNLCNDKYKSMVALSKLSIAAPDTVLCDDEENLKLFLERNQFPIIIKPRFGASSKNIFLIKNRDVLLSIRNAFPEGHFIAQEHLSNADEYTIGVYISKDRVFRKSFVIKRELKFGLSYKGIVIEDQLISDYCINLCSMLNASFSLNVQLRIKEGLPYAFEINPRLSSTTSVRARFGFNEPEMIIQELFYGSSSLNVDIKKGKFMRYWEEVYLV